MARVADHLNYRRSIPSLIGSTIEKHIRRGAMTTRRVRGNVFERRLYFKEIEVTFIGFRPECFSHIHPH